MRAALQNQLADVRLDRLRVEALLPDPREQHLRGTLPGAEAGHLDPVGEIVRRVLDRVLDLAGGHLDRQADAIAVELLELGLHRRAIESERSRPAARGRTLAGR